MRNSRLRSAASAAREEVAAYNKAERQWPRALRIAHATRMLAEQPERKQFWNAVLKTQGAK